MGSSDWFELETLNTEIAHSRARLEAARKTKNHGQVKVLQREIADAERRRAGLLSHITTQIGRSADIAQHSLQPSPWGLQAHATEKSRMEEASGDQHNAQVALLVEADVAPSSPHPPGDQIEGVAEVWDQLSRFDIERLKRELGTCRAMPKN